MPKQAPPILNHLRRASRLVLVVFVLGLSGSGTAVLAQRQGGAQAPHEINRDGVAAPRAQAFQNANRQLAALPPQVPAPPGVAPGLGVQAEELVSPRGMSSTLNLMMLLTVLSLAPSILMMTTCFIRFVIVFGLLRQALGTQQLPPNQVMISLSLFMTFMVMAPVWQQSYEQGIRPYTNPAPGEAPLSLEEMFQNTARPLRRFMHDQVEQAGNGDSIWMFIDYLRPDPDSPEARSWRDPENEDEVPLVALLPAYMLSELKVAFSIGFRIYLPFVVIDMVIAAVLISMGMMMLPPVLVSLPFKLLLFVLIDGWGLTVGMMLASVRPG